MVLPGLAGSGCSVTAAIGADELLSHRVEITGQEGSMSPQGIPCRIPVSQPRSDPISAHKGPAHPLRRAGMGVGAAQETQEMELLPAPGRCRKKSIIFRMCVFICHPLYKTLRTETEAQAV